MSDLDEIFAEGELEKQEPYLGPDPYSQFLEALIRDSKINNNYQRFGQYLVNALQLYDKKHYDGDFVARLFNIEAEDLIDALAVYRSKKQAEESIRN